MRAVYYDQHGDVDVLQVGTVPDPHPGESELVIDVEAAGVNPIDTYLRSGEYSPTGRHTYSDGRAATARAYPRIPGSDGAGVVAECGSAVTRFEPGDRVVATGLGRDRQGTYAQQVVAPTDRVVHLPESVPFEEAAGLGVVGVTAWRALVDHADLAPAELCLVHGGSGGVGHVAVQLADVTGARVVTTASPKYAATLEQLGADVVLEYAAEDLSENVLDVGRPQVILDHRFDEYAAFDVEVAAKRGRIVAIGNTEPSITIPDLPAARATELELYLMSMSNTPDIGAVLEQLVSLMGKGQLTVNAARSYSLEEAREAQRAVTNESFLGKLVVRPDG